MHIVSGVCVRCVVFSRWPRRCSRSPTHCCLTDSALSSAPSLSRAHSSFVGPSRDPDMHTTITFTADRAIDLTDKQLEAWRPWLAKTRRAVLRCHMNMSMVKLLDGVSETLESLEADSHSVQHHEVASRFLSGYKEPLAFPRLKTVVVGGRWAWASFLRAWTHRWVQIQDSSFQRSLRTIWPCPCLSWVPQVSLRPSSCAS